MTVMMVKWKNISVDEPSNDTFTAKVEITNMDSDSSVHVEV
jgi:Asp-tRNA(Asn)/Glu-tRNA(Gln) amidotransferase B subunit